MEPDAIAIETEALVWETDAVVVCMDVFEDSFEAGVCRRDWERLGVGGLVEGELDRGEVIGALDYSIRAKAMRVVERVESGLQIDDCGDGGWRMRGIDGVAEAWVDERGR